jgi:hypothetical protein
MNMSVKLFILGRPGSGKSTAYRQIQKSVKEHHPNWSAARFNDYDILQGMFLYEKLYLTLSKHKRFCEANHGGFDVRDFIVLDIALKDLEKQVRQRYVPSNEEIFIIEFARQNYCKALSLFSSSFLRDAYFLFIEADTKTCLQRVRDRVTDPPTPDNHFVSKNILTEYYGKQHIPLHIKTSNGDCIEKFRIKVINSRGTIQDFNFKVEEFVTRIISNEDSLYKIPSIPKIRTPSKLSRIYSQISKKITYPKERVGISQY